MSNKFTEEQYQKIVNVSDEYQEKKAFGIIGGGAAKTIGSELYETTLSLEIDFYNKAKEIMAIANPLTREWAHDKFVEKEKKYYWTSKKEDKKGFSTRIMMDYDGLVRTYPINEIKQHAKDEQLTESEIKSWGYNPEMFDKEEV